MATQAQHAQQLREIVAQNEKARQEIVAKIDSLEQAIEDAGNTTPEVDEALAELKASIQKDDDLNPDVTEPEEPTDPEVPEEGEEDGDEGAGVGAQFVPGQ